MFRPTTGTSTIMLRIAAAAVAVSLLTLEDVQADRPELGFRKEPHPSHGHLTYVWASFPEVPGLTCDAWCYESSVEFLDFQKLEDGTVSRDGKHLIALANGSADMLCNAWHDCLHNNPKWTPADAPPAEQRWRLKIYVMPNDPAALLARMAEDFPESTRLGER